jgi:hypothetical protein
MLTFFSPQRKSCISQAISSLSQSASQAAAEFDEFIASSLPNNNGNRFLKLHPSNQQDIRAFHLLSKKFGESPNFCRFP